MHRLDPFHTARESGQRFQLASRYRYRDLLPADTRGRVHRFRNLSAWQKARSAQSALLRDLQSAQ